MLHSAKHISGLPYQIINDLLSLKLEHDIVHLSEKAIQHMRERHSKDFALCITAIETIITKPDFAGQSPLHPENFVLIKKIADVYLLVALSAIAHENEEYPVQSSYIIDSEALQRRLRKGYLKPL